MIKEIILSVTLTCYHAVAAQCNGDSLTTASGAVICSTDSAYTHRYIVVSRDLLDEFPYGTPVEITGCSIEEYNGTWLVTDTMNKRYEGCVDVLISPGMPLTKEQVMIKLTEL